MARLFDHFDRVGEWFFRCSIFAGTKGASGGCPGFLRGLQQYQFSKRSDFAGLTGCYSFDFNCERIAVAAGDD